MIIIINYEKTTLLNCLLNEKILGAEATQVGSEFHCGIVKGTENEL